MVEVYAEKCPNYSTVTHWVRKFKSGFLSVMDEPREGRPTSVVTEKNVSTVEGLVKQDRRITVKQLASETRISVGSVEKILHDHLNLNKVSARWVPRLLTADQKKERADCCKHLLRLEANDDLFFQKIVTMDETWIYQFDPEPKNASMQWKRPSSPRFSAYPGDDGTKSPERGSNHGHPASGVMFYIRSNPPPPEWLAGEHERAKPAPSYISQLLIRGILQPDGVPGYASRALTGHVIRTLTQPSGMIVLSIY
ncbi:hypothetical protein EGW08_019863 [Elysia chlorotica]|uniref:Mos1 transposase HTH domain-containing protein n=1 Tax=Elysia chlorotica TaxID=188477 RepID=A0A3S1B5D5_ELYCH|nr:hypothetical protein EGW08_019863 [Elysia chlorotica]